jgi:hypothetical protein
MAKCARRRGEREGSRTGSREGSCDQGIGGARVRVWGEGAMRRAKPLRLTRACGLRACDPAEVVCGDGHLTSNAGKTVTCAWPQD